MSAVLQEKPESADFVTILTSKGLTLTKVWQADGTIADYQKIKQVIPREVGVSGIHGLARLLEKLAGMRTSCVIRGRLREGAELCGPNTYHRNTATFSEHAHHWVMFDIDGYEPIDGLDPVKDAQACVLQFIERRLPAEFRDVTCYWRLSASAGSAKNVGKLKAHLWFWLATDYTGGELTAWKSVKGIDVDVVSFRTVQIHYTADPVFEAGVADPVPVRGGLIEGAFGDEVQLEIPPQMRALARDHDGSADGVELADPKEKPGLIGAFCRAFSIEDVIDRWLDDVFEFEDVGNTRRLNFLQGNGAKGGAFVSGCREYISNTHNTDPLNGRATNKWDLVRYYTFGHLDDPDEPFENATNCPSNDAMREFAKGLPEVQEQMQAERAAVVQQALGAADQLKARITAAQTEAEIVSTIVPEIKATEGLDDYARESIAQAIKARLKAITGTAPGIGMVRQLIKPDRVVRNPDDGFTGPRWAREWAWVMTADCYINTHTKTKVSITGFNGAFGRHLGDLAMGEDSFEPHTMMTKFWACPVVDETLYYPPAGPVFEIEGVRFANTYRSDLRVDPDLGWTPGGERMREAIERHLVLLVPDEREQGIFRSWLAFNYLHPGVKIRWAPILKGCEGDGKSLWIDLLGAVLGAGNTRSVAGDTILNSNFTGWASGACVAMLEELRFQGHNRYEIANRLKPLITNNRIEYHPKNRDPITILNTTNYMGGTNHTDMLPITEGDRRYFVLHSPHESGAAMDEMLRVIYGLTKDEHFDELFRLVRENPGQLALWLSETEFSEEFNPNGAAPMTEAKRVTVAASEGEEVEILRLLIEDGAPGICKHAVSVPHLKNALVTHGLEKVSDNALATALERLGFKRTGKDGARQIRWDGGKFRVWVSARSAKKPPAWVAAQLNRTLTEDFE